MKKTAIKVKLQKAIAQGVVKTAKDWKAKNPTKKGQK